MTMTENNLAELSQMQSEELAKCRQALVDAYNDREDAHEVIRDLLGAIAVSQTHTAAPSKIGDSALATAKIVATKLLARYTTEAK